jgi:hypothetical protein
VCLLYCCTGPAAAQNRLQVTGHVLDGADSSAKPPTAKQIDRVGNWTVTGKESYRGKHIRLDGNLVLPEGAELTLDDCTLEILGDYSREHSVEWEGGTLITRNCKLGGVINQSGTAIHTVFHLYDGTWEATDTVVQYSYGISFHWKEGHGVLRGTRLIAGPRPDAIILSGQANVKLVDSSFPIGLGIYVNKGGSTTLDLQPGKPITATYDRSNLLPGVDWRLEMQNTQVERWFVFVRQIGMHNEPAEIILKHSKDLIMSLLGHNLTGSINLSKDLLTPLRVGNVTLRASDGPAGISMYAVYLSGDKNDVSVTGRSHICELMHRGGSLRVTGTPGENEISIGCTTLELSGNARMEVRNVHMGRPLEWKSESSIGEATIADSAILTGGNITTRDVRFRTEDSGQVKLTAVTRHGQLIEQVKGGPISVLSQ